MSDSNPPVQYNGPIYMNTAYSITEYKPPTSEIDQRPEVVFVAPKYPKQPVPKISSPIMDRIPQDEVVVEDKLSEEERHVVFLENGGQGPLQMHESHLEKHSLSPDVSPLFFGAISIFGLFVVYRAMQNYS